MAGVQTSNLGEGGLKDILLKLQLFKGAIFLPASPPPSLALAQSVVQSFSVCPLHWKAHLGFVLSALEGRQHSLLCVWRKYAFTFVHSLKHFSLCLWCFGVTGNSCVILLKTRQNKTNCMDGLVYSLYKYSVVQVFNFYSTLSGYDYIRIYIYIK